MSAVTNVPIQKLIAPMTMVFKKKGPLGPLGPLLAALDAKKASLRELQCASIAGQCRPTPSTPPTFLLWLGFFLFVLTTPAWDPLGFFRCCLNTVLRVLGLVSDTPSFSWAFAFRKPVALQKPTTIRDPLWIGFLASGRT